MLLVSIFKHYWAPTELWKNILGVLESPGKVMELFVSKRVGTLNREKVFHELAVNGR